MNLAPVGNQTSIVGGKQNDGMDAANGHDKEVAIEILDVL